MFLISLRRKQLGSLTSPINRERNFKKSKRKLWQVELFKLEFKDANAELSMKQEMVSFWMYEHFQ